MADVLVIDDSEFIRAMICTVCEAEGWTPHEAGSGAEARALLESVSPRVVVLDFHLPDAFGADLVPEIRAAAPGCKVVGLSMQPRTHVRKRYAEADVDLVLDKETVLRNQLVEILRNAVAETGAVTD